MSESDKENQESGDEARNSLPRRRPGRPKGSRTKSKILPTRARGQSLRAAARAAGDWVPTPLQEKALAAVANDPELATSATGLAEACQMSAHTVYNWRRDPRFRQWWSNCLRDLADATLGPAMLVLVEIFSDKTLKPQDRISAVKTLLGGLGDHRREDSVSASVEAILSRFSTTLTRAKIAKRGNDLALDLTAGLPLAGMVENGAVEITQAKPEQEVRVEVDGDDGG